MTANDNSENISAANAERKRRIQRFILWLLFAALCIGLRVWRLDTDAYRGLSADPGLFTDEGFYTHSARNVALFGRAQTDDFNNSLLMPTLHYAQVFVFRCFGYGILQARFLSITLGLLTLPVLYAAMKRAFGAVPAVYAVVFLGLEHVPLLYSRMALMDTAAAFLLVCAFGAFTFALTSGGRRAAIGAAVCGLALGLLYATRSLAAVGIAAPFLASGVRLPGMNSRANTLVRLRGQGKQGLHGVREGGQGVLAREFIPGAILAGLLFALTVYAALWYLPHRAEIVHVSRFHIRGQLLPKSAREFGGNLWRSAANIRLDGLFPYLIAHSPVLLFLTVSIPFFRRNKARLSDVEARCIVYLTVWLCAFFALFAFASYAPSRYYALFYPALCGLAGIALGPNPPAPFPGRSLRITREGGVLNWKWSRFLKAGQGATNASFSPFPVSAANELGKGAGGLGLLLTVWLIINFGWYTDWARNLTTTQKDASEMLARTLPPDSVLLGDCAPGLGIYNRFVTVNVMPGLCNDRDPLAQWAGRPRYVAILDGPYKAVNEKWWILHYPNVMRVQNRMYLFNPLVSHPVGVYKVEAKDAVWRIDKSP